MTHTTPLGDPIGAPVANWSARPLPPRATLTGRYVRLEPQTLAAHGDDLWAAFSADATGADWTHRFVGPFTDRATFDAWLLAEEQSATHRYFAYVDQSTGKAVGNGAFMDMNPSGGSIEVGCIMFSPALQQTRAATEAIYLHMAWAFDTGYRRFEWTCDPLNARSMTAAERFGLSYEAWFRNAYVSKGRSRDKAYFAITDQDWPAIRAAFETWLEPSNFDAGGQQKQSLRALTAPSVHARTDADLGAETNDLGQPVGPVVKNWTPPPRPSRMRMQGQYCHLEPLCVEHAEALHAAHLKDDIGRNWTYLPTGPFDRVEDYRAWVWDAAISQDPLHYTIVTDQGPVGTASYLRIAPSAGSIEVGFITFSPLLQRTRASTEAMFLMMQWAFDAGYRRYEWKCNALNRPSRVAAERLGFSFEGIFRQAVVTKGANRDTAWFGATDDDWPQIRTAMQTWLDPANFDADGRQRQSLRDLTRPVLKRTDPL